MVGREEEKARRGEAVERGGESRVREVLAVAKGLVLVLERRSDLIDWGVERIRRDEGASISRLRRDKKMRTGVQHEEERNTVDRRLCGIRAIGNHSSPRPPPPLRRISGTWARRSISA
jgi:hypothetical protein